MENQLTVMARVKAKQGKEDLLKEALQSLVPLTRAEEGCVSYHLHQSLQDSGVFVFFEKWRSKADMDAHLGQPYIATLIAQAPEILDGPLEIVLLQEI
jgi:quinol monooxygenase YgiN